MQLPEDDQQRAESSQSHQYERENAADPVKIGRKRFRAAKHHEPAGAELQHAHAESDEQQAQKESERFHLRCGAE